MYVCMYVCMYVYCNEDEFIKASGKYQNVLKNSGCEDKLIYTP